MSVLDLLNPKFLEILEEIEDLKGIMRNLSLEVGTLKKLVELNLTQKEKDKAKVFISPNVSFEPIKRERRNQLPNTLSDYLDKLAQDNLDRQIAEALDKEAKEKGKEPLKEQDE